MRKRKLLAIVLALAMTLSLLPVTALAEEGGAASLPEAVNGTITLTENVTLDSEWLVTDNTVLDLNGFTLSNSSVTTSDYRGTITLQSGNLTIEDTSENQTGRVEGARFAVVVQGGTLTVNGGTFGKVPSVMTGWNEPLFVGGGTAGVTRNLFFG